MRMIRGVKELVAYLASQNVKISESTIYRLKKNNEIPYTRISSRVTVYDLEKIDKWLIGEEWITLVDKDNRTHHATSQCVPGWVFLCYLIPFFIWSSIVDEITKKWCIVNTKGDYVYVFSSDAKVKLVYVQDASRDLVIYEGDITGFKDNLSVQKFRGFEYGQSLTIVDEDVEIISVFESVNSDSLIINIVYYAGSERLNVI